MRYETKTSWNVACPDTGNSMIEVKKVQDKEQLELGLYADDDGYVTK